MEGLEFFFWESLAGLTIVSLAAFALTMLGQKGVAILKALYKERTHRIITSATMLSLTQSEGRGNHLIAHFIQATGKSEYARKFAYRSVLVDFVLTQLERHFPKMEVTSQECGIGNPYCHSIYKFISETAGEIFLSLNWESRKLWDSQKRVQYVGKKISVKDFVYPDERDEDNFIATTGVDIMYHANIDESDPDIAFILSLLDTAEIEAVNYEIGRSFASIYHLAYNGVMGYSLEASNQNIGLLDAKALNASYSEVAIAFKGGKYFVDMADGIGIMLSALKAGSGGITFRGVPGVGKTSLMQQLQLHLTLHEPNFRVIAITPAQAIELQQSAAQGSLIRLLGKDATNGIVNVFFIDEAESLLKKEESGIHSVESTFLLQLMNGGLQKQLNARVVMAINANPSQLIGAAFRSMRMAMDVELQALPKAQADTRVAQLRNQYADRVFDNKRYDMLVTEKNVLPDGTICAEAGFITLSDIYSCFIHQSQYAAIVAALKKYDKRPVMPVVTAESLRPKLVKKTAVVDIKTPISPATEMRIHHGGKSKKRKKRKSR